MLMSDEDQEEWEEETIMITTYNNVSLAYDIMHRVLIATRKQATHRLNLLILRCVLHKMTTDMCRLPLLNVFSIVDGNSSFQHA